MLQAFVAEIGKDSKDILEKGRRDGDDAAIVVAVKEIAFRDWVERLDGDSGIESVGKECSSRTWGEIV